MMVWLWSFIGILVLLILGLLFKIHMLRKAAGEIADGFADRLVTDTNTLIGISGRDRQMRRLADAVNEQLRRLRAEHHRFCQGDAELKGAVTNLSHDLRTPLTAICGYLDLLEKEEKSEAAKRYIDIIRNRSQLLVSMTEELFQYSVLLSRENNAPGEPVVLNQVLEESIAAAYTVLTERNITPRIRMPREKVVRMLDASALSRVFSNLLQNAVKYSDGDLEITLESTGEIVFANRAPGLDEIQVGRLFDRFFTVESARKSTGLGLAIARSLVEQMGGSISAEYTDDRLHIWIFFRERGG
ncbi:MAG: HAMP domain-containing histidine kinase [Lachnospiraceae bacterium]|jgi:signal transduction histidine kinase|nr:HAMP domain-containing sensor histidine kinase [uncultured Acetatifactor sp.]MCI9231785.1 HAMP domain-containing histidine kinase [Lachnospiraceae bacterium]